MKFVMMISLLDFSFLTSSPSLSPSLSLSIEPCPGHQVASIQYSPTGSTFIVAGIAISFFVLFLLISLSYFFSQGGDERLRLYDRDGKQQQIYAKGLFLYIHYLSNSSYFLLFY
jgi:hypothetical protein